MVSRKLIKKRLIVCNGVAQLMFVDACLNAANEADSDVGFEDYLIFAMNEKCLENRKTLVSISDGLRAWSSIDNICIGEEYAEAVADLLSSYGSIDQLWVCMPGKPVDQAAMKRFPDAELVFYEDGLNAYTELHSFMQLARHPFRALKWSRQKIVRRLKEMGFLKSKCLWPDRKFDHSWLLLGHVLHQASRYRADHNHHVEPKKLLATVRRVREIANPVMPRIESPEKTIVFLGSIFYMDDLMSRKEEFETYERLIAKIIEKGYRVLWKEHPRSVRPFGPELSLIFGIEFDSVQGKMFPAELMFVDSPFAGCVSPHSTSLFLLPVLFQTRSFNTVKHFEKSYTKIIKAATKTVLRHTEPIEGLERFTQKAVTNSERDKHVV